MANLIEKIKDKRAPAPETPERRDVPVAHPDPQQGLTSAQVRERADAGWTNAPVDPPGKTVKQIVLSNIFTYFNMLFFLLALCVIAVQQWLNLTFMGVIIVNTAIGIIQEIRSKKTLDKLSILASPKAVAVRDGRRVTVDTAQLVRDDIVVFAAGNQIYADAVVAQDSCYVNEALITGESDEIKKNPGDKLLSGSFVVSGMCRAQLTDVGADSYVSRLTQEAKRAKKPQQSEMMRSLQNLVKWIGILVIPLGVVMFVKEYVWLGRAVPIAVTSTVGSIIGMIPEGLYLLTSLALVAGVVRLAQRKTLVHELGCIETLARVDVLCVDKTGTITEPGMNVQEAHAFECAKNDQFDDEALQDLLADYCLAAQDTNETMQALRAFSEQRRLEHPQEAKIALDIQPFSSSKKYSSITFETGTYLFGAPEFVLKGAYAQVAGELKPFLDAGCRVLLLAKIRGEGNSPEPLGYAVLTGRVRENAKETFAYFKEQDVTVKVISGDNARTVSEIAKQAGIENADKFVDAAMLVTDEQLARAAETYTVFGRVTPSQKQKLVQAMQAAGHTVAMTGDGVNDVLALKDADCGIAMASGAQAASQVAQLVLLESDFSGLPAVVAEGRRVINNIQRSASLFLVKNIFSFLLTFIALFITMPYPLQPLQLSLLSMVTIGIPSFILALEPNHEMVHGKFIQNVLRAALPGGLSDLLLILGIEAFVFAFELPIGTLTTLTTLLLLAVGMAVLWDVCKPFTVAHGVLWGGMLILAGAAIALLGGFLGLERLDMRGMLILIAFLLLVVQTLHSMERGLTAVGDAATLVWKRLPRKSKAEENY